MEWWLPGTVGEGNGALMVREFPFGKMTKFWRWICGDGCTTMGNALNATELYTKN